MDIATIATIIAANATPITLFLTLIGVIIAMGGLISQSRMTMFSLRIELLLRMEKDFNNEDMLRVRKAAAKKLKSGADSGDADLDQVLDFFDGLGILARKGALDLDMLWNNLSFYAVCYWHASSAHINAVRRSDRHYWENYADLVRRLSRISVRKYGTATVFPTEADLAYFYKIEAGESNRTVKRRPRSVAA